MTNNDVAKVPGRNKEEEDDDDDDDDDDNGFKFPTCTGFESGVNKVVGQRQILGSTR